MPRPVRTAAGSGIHHFLLQGINRQNIFTDDADMHYFLRILERCRQKSGFSLYCYCLLYNHLHLVLRIADEPAETVFRRIGCAYVSYYNRRYERSGPLFQGRYRSEPADSPEALYNLLRRLFFHPVHEGLCLSPEQYAFCSARDYLYGGLTDTSEALTYIKPAASAVALFKNPDAHEAAEILDVRTPAKKISDEYLKIKLVGVFGIPPGKIPVLPPLQQRRIVLWLKGQEGVSLRQAARICGLPLSRVYRM